MEVWAPWKGEIPDDGLLTFTDFILGNMTHPKREPRTELGFLQPVYRRAFIHRHGMQYQRGLQLGEDATFYAQALARGAIFRVIDEFGYVAVQRPFSLSHRHKSADLKAYLEASERRMEHPLSSDERLALKQHLNSLRQRWVYHLALDAKADGVSP